MTAPIPFSATALAVAGAAGQPETGQPLLEVGLMRLCGRDLAVPAATVREVVPLPERLHPDFRGTGGCAGSIVIRGRVIPVLDIAQKLGFPPREGGRGVVLILRHEARLIGLIMDLVSGLARIPAEHVQPFGVRPGEDSSIVASSFPYGDTLVGLIDPVSVFETRGVPFAQEPAPAGVQQGARGVGAVVLVSVADANLAFSAELVVATVPGVQIAPSPAPASKWVGVVRYLNHEVPVIDDLALFGLAGRAAEGPGGAVIILKVDQERMLGLKIDRVRRILAVNEQALRPLPPALAAQLSLFAGAVVDHEGQQNLLLERDALTRSEDLRMIGALGRATGGAESCPTPATGRARTTGEVQPFVVFSTGGKRRAAPLAAVKQIIPFPAEVTGLRRPGSALRGIATYHGAPLPLLDLAGPDAAGPAALADRMVLVVEDNGAFNGLIVERLETIARTVLQRRQGPSGEDRFIQARVEERTQAVTLCDLAGEVDRLAGDALAA